MIKKLIITLLVILIFLSGCSYSDYLEPENRSIVTAIYLYGNKKEISIILETVNEKSENDEEGYKPLYINGSGRDFNEALNNAQLNFSKEFSLYHCPLIICDYFLFETSSDEVFSQILNNSQISLSANFLLSEDFTNEIKSKKSDEFLGYEITDVIQLKNVKTTIISILKQGKKPKKLIIDKNKKYNIAENGNE